MVGIAFQGTFILDTEGRVKHRRFIITGRSKRTGAGISEVIPVGAGTGSGRLARRASRAPRQEECDGQRNPRIPGLQRQGMLQPGLPSFVVGFDVAASGDPAREPAETVRRRAMLCRHRLGTFSVAACLRAGLRDARVSRRPSRKAMVPTSQVQIRCLAFCSDRRRHLRDVLCQRKAGNKDWVATFLTGSAPCLDILRG
jgi:hypothetical protein